MTKLNLGPHAGQALYHQAAAQVILNKDAKNLYWMKKIFSANGTEDTVCQYVEK